MDTTNITIETKNLFIRTISLADKDDIFKEFTDEITTHMFPKPADNIEETIDFIQTSIKENKEGSNFQIVILNKETKEFLGCGGIHHIDQKTPELGIWIKKSAHGNGYGKEAVIGLKEWADANLDYEYLLYPVDAQNLASKRIPEFFGGKIAREYQEINMSGNKLNLQEYRIYPNSSLYF
jgi:ribosomal-protein-alanine N-acetyltransferase